MARVNEILAGRYNRFLQKFLSMKGPAPAPQLSGEIAATWALFHGAENRYLEGWNRFGFNLAFAASAGNQNGFQLRNPSTSGVIVCFEKLFVASSQAGTVQYSVSQGVQAADLATAQSMSNARLDPRGNPSPSLVASKTQAAAIADLANTLPSPFVGIATGLNAQEDLILDENQELVLLPGDALSIRTLQQNIASSVAFLWRERILEDSEKT